MLKTILVTINRQNANEKQQNFLQNQQTHNENPGNPVVVTSIDK